MENYYFEEDDVFEAYGKDYVTLSNLNYNGNYYILVSEIKNELPVNRYDVFECLKEGIKKVSDIDLKNILLEKFSDDINDKISKITNEARG